MQALLHMLYDRKGPVLPLPYTNLHIFLPNGSTTPQIQIIIKEIPVQVRVIYFTCSYTYLFVGKMFGVENHHQKGQFGESISYIITYKIHLILQRFEN
jgi:hypothetical protein